MGSTSRTPRTKCLVCLLVPSACLAEVGSPSARPTSPKYTHHAIPLSREGAYFREAPAPDFWALAPYYTGQQDDVSCSLATMTMVINSARRRLPLGADDPLATQTSVFRRTDSAVWRRGLVEDGDGVTLDELAVLAAASLRSFGLSARVVKATHVAATTPEALRELRATLERNEASAGDWVILNFLAEAYVGTGEYGHFAPVGAYDAARARVLVLDPDREFYEPYWIPDTVALAGMATPDAVTGQPRGYLYISVAQ